MSPIHRRDTIKAGCMLAATFAVQGKAWSDSGTATDTPNAIAALAQSVVERHRHSLIYTDTVGIADFGQHCSQPRFHLVDMMSGVIDSLLVAHGEGSDPDDSGWLQLFSNEPGSRATSEGSYLVRNAYDGEYGPSRRISGLDPENSNALDRAIVIHPADYVSMDMAKRGMIGTSWGCFAFAHNDIAAVLERLGPGRLLHACRLPAQT